jgi:hypothetical protein
MRDPKLTPDLFLQHGKIIRMGVPPMRIEVLTEIDGITFPDCFAAREEITLDGQRISTILSTCQNGESAPPGYVACRADPDVQHPARRGTG